MKTLDQVLQDKCTCCGQGDIKGQWWFFSGYSVGDRLVSGYYCPSCSKKVYEERKKHHEHCNN